LRRSQVSWMAAALHEHMAQFRHRPLGAAGPFTCVATNGLTMKVREGGMTDEWAEGRRYLGLDVLTCCRLTAITNPHPEIGADTMPALTA